MAAKTWDPGYFAKKRHISEINISFNTHVSELGFVKEKSMFVQNIVDVLLSDLLFLMFHL